MKTKPLVVSGGLVCGHSTHLLDLYNGFIQSGTIKKGEKVDFVVHTWDIPFNNKYIKSLNRYADQFNFKFIIESYEKDFLPDIGALIHPEEIKQGHYKTFLIGYSLWKIFNSISNIEEYDVILKYKMDVMSSNLPWGVLDDVREHFKRISIFSHPTLYNYSYTDCFYASHVHKGFDERHFITFSGPIKKLFLKKPLLVFLEELKQICLDLYRDYGIDVEFDIPWRVQGTTMWGELLNRHNIPFVNVPNLYNNRSRGEISPKFVVEYENNSYLIKDKDNYKYTPWNSNLT